MTIKVSSLGWGLQSWTIAAMGALGELPKANFYIHADTTWERQATYEFAKAQTPWLREHGLNVITVSDPASHGVIHNEWEGTFIPAFTLDKNLNSGMLRRQCTSRWKIQPIRAFIRGVILSTHLPMEEKIYAFDYVGHDFEWCIEMNIQEEVAMYDILAHVEEIYGKIQLPKWIELIFNKGLHSNPYFELPKWAQAILPDKLHSYIEPVIKKLQAKWIKWDGRFAIKPNTVEQWFGITVDEIHRVKDSDVVWINNRYPLVELGMRRSDCEAWLKKRDLPIPPKSSCSF